MPIFEYICRDCQQRFETIVTASRVPECPGCHGRALEKQHSVFAVSTSSARSSGPAPMGGACGSCGDPRGPGSCSMN